MNDNATKITGTQSTDGLAIAGFATSFVFWPAGLVLNPLALDSVRKNGKPGKGLAIAGLCISIVGLLITSAVVTGALLLAKPLGDRALAAALGAPLSISEDVTMTTRAMSCFISEESFVNCEVKATITNNREREVTVGPELMIQAVGRDGHTISSIMMEPTTVQSGMSGDVVIKVTASDEDAWFRPSFGDFNHLIGIDLR